MGLSERLKTARNERGLTLETASAKSNVALRYARMFEAGSYPLVADPVYLATFVRRYAACLGLNEVEASREFIAEVENPWDRRRSDGGSASLGSRPGQSRPRLFNYYVGPLSLIAVVWTVGPLSPLSLWAEKTPAEETIVDARREGNALRLIREQPVTTAPVAPPPPLPDPLPRAPLAPPAPVAPPPPLSVPVPVVEPFVKAPAIVRPAESGVSASRRANDEASDRLRAEQIARLKQKMMSAQGAPADGPGA